MIDSRILIGLIAMLITIAAIVYIGINEPDRQEEFEQAFAGRSIETGALVFEEACSPCHGPHGEGTPRGPQINSQEFFENRLDELGFPGSMDSYLMLTVSGGRPAMSGGGAWPENMPTWSVDFGGPLRNDQIRNVVDFIKNWEDGAPSVEDVPTEPVGDTPQARGRSLFEGAAGCLACHAINGVGGAVGPDLGGVYAREGEDYVRESILNPSAVIAEGFTDGIMPQTYATTLSDENLNDIVAYLESVSN